MKKIAMTVAGAACSLVFITGCSNSNNNTMNGCNPCMPDQDMQCGPCGPYQGCTPCQPNDGGSSYKYRSKKRR